MSKLNQKNSSVKKGVVAFIIIIVIMIALMVRKNIQDVQRTIRTDVRLAFKTQEVFMNDTENTSEMDAKNSIRNVIVYATINDQSVGNMITGTDGDMYLEGNTLIYKENKYIITIDNIKVEGQRNVTVTCQESGKTVTGSFNVVFAKAENEPSTGKGLNIYHGPAHTAEKRNIEGVTNGTVDGTSMEAISGTPAGEQVIANDPNLNYDEAGNLQKDSELPEQVVEEVELPQSTPSQTPETTPETPQTTPEPTPEIKPEDGVQVDEGIVEMPTEQPEEPTQPETQPVEQTVTISVGSVCVLNSPDAEECAYTLWGDGSQTAFGTAEELGLQDMGNGLVNSIYGFLRK